MDAAIKSGEQVGVAFVDPEQESLFGGGAVLAVCAANGCAVFEGEEVAAPFARLVAQGSFAALDVKAALHRIYPSGQLGNRAGRRCAAYGHARV